MKRFLCLLLSFCLPFSFFGCSSTPPENESGDSLQTPATSNSVTEPSSEPTSPSEMQPPISQLEHSARITVTNTVVNTVKSEVFGDNTSYSGEGYGLWDVDTNAPEETLLEMLKNSGVTHIRYPGGIEGDYYHWYEIIGDNRIAQIDPFSHEFPTYTPYVGAPYDVIFGIEELVELCDQAGIKPTLQVNAGTGTPQEAADLVQYCLDNNIDTTFFAIGNELFSQANPVAGINIQKSPAEYVAFYKECYEKIRAIDGSVRIGAVGVPRTNPLCRDMNWEPTVLRELAGIMDFYDVHIAYAPLLHNGDPQVLLESYLSGSVWVKNQLDLVKNDMKRYAGEHYGDIDIYITEWGTLGGGAFDNCMAGSVYIATILNMMLNEPKITAANHLPLLNHPAACNLIGFVEQNGEKYYWENASSYVFRWYSAMQNRSVLECEIQDSPIFNTTANVAQPATHGVKSVETITFIDEKTGTGTIILTNRDPERDIAVTIDLPFEVTQITDVREVWHNNPLAYNSAQNPNVIQEAVLDVSAVTVCDNSLTIDTKSVSVIRIDFSYTQNN